ncbi:MAG: arylesterase [Rhodospirillales bacterium]
MAWLVNALLFFAATGINAQAADTYRIVALGDSLTAGLGLSLKQTFPARLEDALKARGHGVSVVNAGVSGDTTAGGLTRLDWVAGRETDLVIVELGANDGLRGLDVDATYANLEAIIGRLKGRGVRVLLAGMKAPPNLGREYGSQFNRIYPRLSALHEVPLYPFFLAGVAAVPALNQDDGIHPNARGVDVIVANMLPMIVDLLNQID